MKKNMIKITAALLMLVATLGACKKGDKGDAGPSGTNGANGLTGPAGADGTNGTNGTNGHDGTDGYNGVDGVDGNANVKAGTITVVGSSWAYSSTAWEYSIYLTTPDVSSDVFDNGTVQVFISTSNTVWEAIPTTVYYSSSQSYTFKYQYGVGNVQIFIDMSDATTFSSIATYKFKIVAIGGAAKRAHPKTNWTNYNEVMAVINSNGSVQ